MKLNLLFLLLLFHLGVFKCFSSYEPQLLSLKINYDKSQLVLPNEYFEISIISKFDNGDIGTSGRGFGDVPWRAYTVEVTGGKFSKGKILVNKELVPSKGKFIEVHAFHKKYPEKKKRILIPLNYETGLSITPSTQDYLLSGVEFDLELRATFDNGTSRTISSIAMEKLNDYKMFFEGFKWEEGKFTVLSGAPLKLYDNPTVKITSKRNPELTAIFVANLSHLRAYDLIFTGSDGTNGKDGRNGEGGNYSCRDGSTGADGGDAENGEDAPNIGIWMDCYYDSAVMCNLLYIIVENYETHKEYRYVLEPKQGKLTVESNGGNGGNGGHGGNGGDGLNLSKDSFTLINSKALTTTQKTGNGGHGGDGGYGGSGGSGGSFFIHTTKDALPFQDRLVVISNGGMGGKHGDGGEGGKGGEVNGILSEKNGIDGCQGRSLHLYAAEGSYGAVYESEVDDFIVYEK